jgi:hypothetical protein
VSVAEPETERPPTTGGITAERAAAAVFALSVVVAAVFYVRIGARNWFFLDEWDFLADRSLTSARDLLEPHNEHWSTLPIIAYRIQFKLFGLRSYVPYVVAVVALHLSAATLLRAIMRKSDVGPWLATAAAGLFLFLGSGFSNIIWGFQIGFTGSLVAGLAHLLLSDHDGPFDRRDLLGLGFGLVGLMCSGVSLTMVGVVGLAVLVRRGWRMAALHTLPLAAVFGAWWLAFGHDAESTARPGPGRLLSFVWTSLSNAARSIGDLDVIAVALVALLLVGGGLALVDRQRTGRPASFAPWALLAGGIAFAVITGIGRAEDLGVESAKASRYVHLIGAMSISAVAASGQALVRRWSWSQPIVVVLLLAGIPGNIQAVSDRDTFEEALLQGNPVYVRTLADAAIESDVAGRVQPDRFTLPGVTVRWLRETRRAGRIDLQRNADPQQRELARTRLLLVQQDGGTGATVCRKLDGKQTIELGKGDRFSFDGGELDVRTVDGERAGPWATYRSVMGTTLRAQKALTVEVRNPPALPGTELCR